MLDSLEPGEKRVLELTARATEKGEHCLKVEAVAKYNRKAEKQICTNFIGAAAMTLEMIGKEGVAFIGHKISYQVVIRNQATDPLTNIKLRAFVPIAEKFVRANAAHDAEEPVKEGQWIEFKTLPKLDGGAQTRYEISVEALKAGVTHFHIEVLADQLESGPVVEQEITNIVDDREKVKIKELSRTKEPPPQ